MKLKISFITLTLVFILSACSSNKVIINFDHNIDFSSYKNFIIMERLESEKIQEDDKKFIGSVISDELKQRGLQQNLSPDMIVKVMIISKEKEVTKVTRNNDFYWGSNYYPYGWGIGTNANKVSYDTYTEGTLIIDVIDREKKQLIWQGISNEAFKSDSSRKQSKIRKMISDIFDQYPVTKK